MRKVISDIIHNDKQIDLVGIAKNGKEGSDMAIALKPHVIITDMVMPDFDGLYLVNAVMEKSPTPIILLSSLERTDSRIFDALQNGAFDFIDKPSQSALKDYRLNQLIKEASLTDISVLKAKQLSRKNAHKHTFLPTLNYDIIAIGASTGGPGAVEHILNNLPENLTIPVIVAQHMPHRFLETFVERLAGQVPLPIKLARKGETPVGGVIYVAPGEGNLKIERNLITGAPMFTITERKFTEYNFPSVDCLFESVARTFGPRSIGVILTGMGKDGADGLRQIREQGGFTIGQDEASCVVYGMPKAAWDSGAVKQVVSLRQIPGYIISCL